MTSPKVCIIIVNWNGLKDTLDCLESLKEITYPNYEVTVVDNGSVGDDVRVLKERFGHYIYLIQNNKNCGFAEGNNIGIREALTRKARYLLLLNNDTVVAPDFVDELVKGAANDETIGILCPKIYHYAKPETLQFAGGKISYLKGRVYHLGFNEVDSGQYEQVTDSEFATGCAMMMRSDLFEKVGLLDSSYFTYFEDVDFSVRVRNAALRIVLAPKAKIWHKGTASTGGYLSPTSYYFHVRNAIRFVLKHGQLWQRLIFMTYFLLIYPFLLLGYGVIHGRLDLVRAFFRGLFSYITKKDYCDLTGC